MKKHIWLAIALLAIAVSLPAQNIISSSVRGTITDSSGAAVVNADCTLMNQATAAALEVKSGADGGCIFPGVLPGTYMLTVKATGFRSIQSEDLVVTAGQVRSLGQLTLEVGEVRETISVTAEVARCHHCHYEGRVEGFPRHGVLVLPPPVAQRQQFLQ